MKLKIIIANRINVNDIMKLQDSDYGVIGITNPYPDPLNYFVLSNRFKGLLKLEFEDSNPGINHDKRMIFSIKKMESILKFAEAMISNDVYTFIIHCDKGKHRSVAVGMKLRDLYRGRGYTVELINISNEPEPNEHVMEVFDAPQTPRSGA